MGLSSEAITLNSLKTDKLKSKMKKTNNFSVGGSRILKFLCMALGGRSSEETKSSTEIIGDPPIAPVLSSSATTDVETTPTTPNRGRELEIASHIRNFSFNELRLATRNFRHENLLGLGGFGSVYKGWINENGSSPVKFGTGLAVAVKILNQYGLQGHREWLAEIRFLGNLQHRSLVKLVGYCMEGDQRLIVYEFMTRGSLENHLFRRSWSLPWEHRMKIVLAAAEGLAYLHEGAQKPVIYRDFKTSNILLDVEYNAKLSDFGLARDGPEGDETHVSTRILGTYGYAAPEYVTTGHLTVKSDVYSFGVVFLEILTGRKAMAKDTPNGEDLVTWAKPYLANRSNFYRIIDPRLSGQFPNQGAFWCTEIVLLCLRRNAKSRPRMSEVVEMLMLLPSMEVPPAPNMHINDAGVNSNGNNVQAGVVAKDKHAAGSLTSLNGAYASSSNHTPAYNVN